MRSMEKFTTYPGDKKGDHPATHFLRRSRFSTQRTHCLVLKDRSFNPVNNLNGIPNEFLPYSKVLAPQPIRTNVLNEPPPL